MPIMYNTLMGLAAGLALLLVPRACASLLGRRMPLPLVADGPVSRRGWAAAFAVLGVVLTGLGGAMTLTHPLAVAKPWIDTLFGEPCLLLGMLLLAAAWILAGGDANTAETADLRAAIGPASWVVVGLGLVLSACAAAIARFDAVSGAPAEEPVSGLLHGHPWVENWFFVIFLYGLAAVGCLVFPAAVAKPGRAWTVLYWSWTVSGACFVLFGTLNFYTHTGYLTNLVDPGPDLRW